MSNLVNLEEIKLAKKIVQDFPDLLIKLDNCANLVYNGKDYIDIAKVLRQIDESKCMMELILETYRRVLEQNGVISE